VILYSLVKYYYYFEKHMPPKYQCDGPFSDDACIQDSEANSSTEYQGIIAAKVTERSELVPR